jgi:hypothetical protein
MLRNFLSLFATLSVGVTTASAAVPTATDQSLDQRLLNARNQIGTIMNDQTTAKPAEATQEAYYCAYGYPCWHNWHNWNNWNNWHNWHNWNNYYNGGSNPNY